MSFANLFTKVARDTALDDVFHSSAGPSTIAKPPDLTSKPKLQDDVGDGHQKNTKRGEARDKNTKLPEKSPKKRKLSNDTRPERTAPVAAERENGVSGDEQSDSDSEGSVPEHEVVTALKSKKKRKSAKTRIAPEDETQETRDARTVFLGNLPVSIVKSKPLQKQLRRHILGVVPLAKIESVRFRSVAFKNPTTKIEDMENDQKTKAVQQSKRQKRAADWRDQHELEGQKGSKRDEADAVEDKKGDKQYLTTAEKRRLSAIRGEVHHEMVATTNAYVVFAYGKLPSESENAAVTKKQVMDPFLAAQEASSELNGTIFAEHAIRSDRVGQSQSTDSSSTTEPRLSIFVGNLDFSSSEDALRAFFEKVIQEERGPRSKVGSSEGANSGLKADGWVARVRVVRDRESQLGKGFAYVQFVDRDCIDTIFTLEPEKLSFAKRTLRVQRCKALTSKNRQDSSSTTRPILSSAHSSPPPNATPVPKGDPELGSRLAGLSKDERKAAKAHDADRIARRIAKKKLRGAAQKAGLEDSTKVSRKRVREKKAFKTNPGRKESKKRMRSDRSIQRRNIKK